MAMNCPNPACKSELFKVNVAWKHRMKEFPQFVPVSITCARCGRHIKAYMVHKDMKAVISRLDGIMTLLLEREDKEVVIQPKKKWGQR